MKKQIRRSEKGFTLIEILIALAILLILSTISIVAYQKFLDRAKAAVCTSNVKSLKNAVDLYIMENDALPAILGDLHLEHLKKGYAMAMEDSDWQTRLSHYFVKINAPSHAHAQFLTLENLDYYGATAGFFRCPSNSSGSISYGINGNLAGSGLSGANPNQIFIADSDTLVFSDVDQFSHRHNGQTVAIGITVRGDVVRTVLGQSAVVDDGNKGHGNDPDGIDPDNPGKSGTKKPPK